MIYLCDFEDSFTYNIFSDLLNEGHQVEVIPYKDILKFLQTKINSTTKEVIVLGPGPGHPQDYQFLVPSIKSLLFRENLFLMGICLGHQLIWKALGHECVHSATPIHGQVRELELNDFWKNKLKVNKNINVQFYNSLCIHLNTHQASELESKGYQLNMKNNELLMSVKDNLLTYQFHPESVGTSCHRSFYGPLHQFLL